MFGDDKNSHFWAHNFGDVKNSHFWDGWFAFLYVAPGDTARWMARCWIHCEKGWPREVRGTESGTKERRQFMGMPQELDGLFLWKIPCINEWSGPSGCTPILGNLHVGMGDWNMLRIDTRWEYFFWLVRDCFKSGSSSSYGKFKGHHFWGDKHALRRLMNENNGWVEHGCSNL